MTEPPQGRVRFRSRLTFRDVVAQLFSTVTRSAAAQAFGAFFLTMTVLLVSSGAPWDAWLPGALFGLACSTGLPITPIAWYTYSRRRDLLTEEVEADETGLTVKSAVGENRQLWAAYRTARETSRTFILLSGGPGGQVFAKTDMSTGEVAAFRQLLMRIGIFREATGLDLVDLRSESS
jgi:hypothetical protein